ncbi:LmeA family phospholipid-binding protein [Streptomyces sp. S186]|uniref:LmeA family phospholipid-binding protein n=1 Tax=Streptomyces sp. S186 TaxID=3434395 RepID=UPI003F677386
MVGCADANLHTHGFTLVPPARPAASAPASEAGDQPHIAGHAYGPQQRDTRELPQVNPANPYADLAALADPEPGTEDGHDGHDGPGNGAGYGAGRGAGYDPSHRRRGYGERADGDDPLGLGLRSDDEDDDVWSPPNHRKLKRGISRFAAVPRTIKALVALAACAGILALGDRFAVLYAQNKAEDQVKTALHLHARPEVDIHGFPFLTQVFDKRLDQVDVVIPDVAADRVSLAKVEATARDIRLDGDLPTAIKGATIGQMHGSVLLAFDDMNRELGASQVKFSEMGQDGVRAVGELPIAGHTLRVRAEARIRRNGERGISTEIGQMRLDIGDVAVYRPGTGKEEGLRLTRKGAAELSRQVAKVKAMLSIPAIVERIGIPKEYLDGALRDDDKLHELIGSPRFVHQLMQVNLVDVVMDHPWLLQKVGIDAKMLGALTDLTKPQLADRLSLSFQLPKTPGNVRLRNITVQSDGIRADLTGTDLPFGDAAKGKKGEKGEKGK